MSGTRACPSFNVVYGAWRSLLRHVTYRNFCKFDSYTVQLKCRPQSKEESFSLLSRISIGDMAYTPIGIEGAAARISSRSSRHLRCLTFS